MKNIFYTAAAIFIFSFSVFAQTEQTQKGVDNQTQKIKEQGNKTTQTQTNTGGGRVIDWGGDKTKVRARLANPYKLNSRRDALLETITDVLESMKILIDDAASRPKDGIVVTQPFIFAKGAVITRSELGRYAVMPNSDTSWTRGRYTLTVEVQSIDGVQNNVSVTAKIEGRSENGFESEWTTLQSSGTIEDEFMVKLVEAVTGTLIDTPKDSDQ
ncbi:MAG TPA: hypothetical protein VGC76_02005 [Pyrinomonadaceae bacterium]|jgi:hypothetical protein